MSDAPKFKTFRDLKQVPSSKDRPKIELVSDTGKPSAKIVVDHKNHTVVNQPDISVVNHNLPEMFTTEDGAVNNSTTRSENVSLLTTKTVKSGKQNKLFTTQEKTVNHKERDWSTVEKKRSSYGNAVESFRTSEDFKKKIKVYCAKNDIDKQDFYRIVVNHYFDTVVDQNSESVVNNLTYDDRRLMTLYKTKPRIINLYLSYNLIFNPKSKWTVRDDEAGLSLNGIDLRIIELGILQTQANKNFSGKINSFSYYLPEIENFISLNMPEDALSVMLDINRRNWNNRTGKSVDLSFLASE